MQPQAPGQRTAPRQGGLPLWLGAVLILALLQVALMARAQTTEPVHPVDPPVPGLELALGEAASKAWLSTPSELPHCHHEHAWRPTTGVLPRSEAPDATPDPSPPIASVAGPSVHLTSALDHILPGPASPHTVPLYLLTQRFRS
ncbi:hypothetical protein D1793_01765 [Halomonas sp. JS92-SW72]|nr:hypothetical protein D1793_01765 [Halomonas sp. JS92-SW72]